MNLLDIITRQIRSTMPRQKSSTSQFSKLPKNILQQHQNNIKNNQLTNNLISKNIHKIQSLECSTPCQECQKMKELLNQRSQELTETKNNLNKKQSEIRSLQQQITEIKLQDQYLLKTIQDLRDGKTKKNQTTELKSDKMYRQKVEELSFANKQISKLKEWLKEEKIEVFRYIECVHIKDQIINNLENQLIKIRQTKPTKKKQKKLQSSSKLQQDELTRFRRKAKQLQQQVYELTQEIDTMRNDNTILKQHLSRVSQNLINNNTQQVSSPIIKLKDCMKISSSQQMIEISKVQEKQNSKNISNISCGNDAEVNKKQKLLSHKCLQLQTQIQRLLLKIEQLKKQNESLRGLNRKEYSFARIDGIQNIKKYD